MAAKRAILMHPRDNVATSVEEIQMGDPVQFSGSGQSRTVTATEAIPFDFKIASGALSRSETLAYSEPLDGCLEEPRFGVQWNRNSEIEKAGGMTL